LIAGSEPALRGSVLLGALASGVKIDHAAHRGDLPTLNPVTPDALLVVWPTISCPLSDLIGRAGLKETDEMLEGSPWNMFLLEMAILF
jgi:hypothetical protein